MGEVPRDGRCGNGGQRYPKCFMLVIVIVIVRVVIYEHE